MPANKSDNDAERLERLKARLAQLHTAGQHAMAKAQEIRKKTDDLLRKTQRKPK